MTSGECLRTLEGHSETVSSVSFSPDGTRLRRGRATRQKAVGCDEGECLQTLEGIFSMWRSFSPDGTKVSEDYDIFMIWNISTGECTFTGEALPNPEDSGHGIKSNA